jgi:hypothetical protein
MITHDNHKLILYPKVKRAILYNLAEDPEELTDLYAQKELRPVAKQLFARLLELQKETGDSLDLQATFPEL